MNLATRLLIIGTLLTLMMVGGFAAYAQTSTEPQTPQKTSIRQALLNCKYYALEDRHKKVKLKNGYFKKQYPGGFSDVDEISILEPRAFGDINGDGWEDAAVLLNENTGGTGEFVSLVLVLNDKGTPKALPGIFLGDRVIVKSLTIESGKIVVDMIDHKPDDGMCCPSLKIKRTFVFRPGRLNKAK